MRVVMCGLVALVVSSACVPPYSPTGERDPEAPQVAAVVPASGAVDVPLDTIISITFTVPVNPTTVTPYSLRLKDAEGRMVGAVLDLSDDGTTVSMEPVMLLAEGKDYTIEVTRQIQDANGIPLDNGGKDSLIVSEFSTIAIPPTVVAVNPEDHATVSPDLAAITVTFSEAMDPATITPSTFLLSDAEGEVSYDPDTLSARFALTEPLVPQHTYTLFVAGMVADMSGVPMGEDRIVRFTTTGK